MNLMAEKDIVGNVHAGLNYIVDTGVPPVRYIDWPEMEHAEVPPQYELHDMTIRNGRPLRDIFNLDTHGFAFTDHPTAVRDFTSEEERKTVYDREVAAPRRLREIVGEAEAERRLKKRWAIIQVWRPIRGKVMTDPLGICDGRTIPQKGFILVQRRYRDRTGEVYHIAYNPEHVWFYFPEMERDEALVFKVFDTDENVPTRFTAHTAFDDPSAPANAPPRESIETRTFAFWD
jgi:hypothetical protein